MKIIVVGAGDVGGYIAKEFSSTRNDDVIIMDTESEALEKVEEQTDVMTFKGNGTFRKNLLEVGVREADLVVGLTSNDSTNLVVTALASELGAKRTIARVDTPEFYSTQRGVERNVLNTFGIVCASRLVGYELMRLVRKIDCPFIENFSTDSVTLAVINVNENCRYLEKPGSDIELGKDAAVVGIFRDMELRRPIDITHLYNGDQILVASKLHRLPVIMRRLSQKFSGKKAVIIGGGNVGYQVAKSLQSVENRLTLIDRDRRCCEFLADNLDNVTVVHGDGTSLSLLQDEHVEMADYVLSVTKADEVNLMSSLVAQEIGVPNTYTLVHRPGYAHVYEHLGVKGTASSHELISKLVQKYLPGQVTLSQSEICYTEHMAGEFQISENIKTTTLKVKDLLFPPGTHVVGLSRDDEFFFLDGDRNIFAGDSLVIVYKKKDLITIEKTIRKIK